MPRQPARRISDNFWAFLMGILIGTTTGVFAGVALVYGMSHGFLQ